MGITPIKDASGLQDIMIPQIAPAKQADNSGNDFKSVWNSQAKDTNTGNDDVLNSVNRRSDRNDNIGNKASDQRADKNGIDNKDSVKNTDNTGRQEKASKTDVKGEGSPEKASDNAQNVNAGGMLKDEEIVSATEVLTAQIVSLVNELAEMLDISTDEIGEMLKAEGIEGLDILDKDILGSFILKTLGADSQLDLLTNEENYAVYSSGLDLLDAVLDQDAGSFDMKVSELLDAVKESVGSDVEIASAVNADIAQLSKEAGASDIVNADRKVSDEPVTRFVRNSEGNLEQVDIDSQGSVSGSGKVVMNAQETGRQKDGSESGHEEKESHPLINNAQADGQFEVKAEAPAEEARPVFSTNAQEIAEQIMDRMKTVSDGDFSDVEMQLHPASLGTLQIRVTNNAGVITAQFITENEAVKSAVESQMMRLSDQLESQGVRVEAVEVTIAPKGFDTGSDARGNETGEGKKGGRTRRINLGDEGELDTSDMEEEERIAAEMMAANGNSVDYTA